ncbi:MAG: hypothetical protein ACKOFX_03530 [Solirubrobacterales bacterium]
MDRGGRKGLLGRVGLATALVLLVLTGLALGVSQRLKRQPLVIDRIEYFGGAVSPESPTATVFSPNGDCRRDGMTIRFRTTRSDRARVEVITPKGEPVDTLARDKFLKRYRIHLFWWEGTDEAGRPAPKGPYKIKVTMLGEGRVLYLPGKIRLHRFPPRQSVCGDRA